MARLLNQAPPLLLLAVVLQGCADVDRPTAPAGGPQLHLASHDACASATLRDRRGDDDETCGVTVDHARRLITVRSGVREIPSPDLNTDRPELSPDGQRAVYSTEDPTPLPVFILSAYESHRRGGQDWSWPRLVKQGVGMVRSGTLQSWFFPTYRPRGDGFLIGLGSARTDTSGIPDFATIDGSFLTLSARGAPRDTVLSARELGFPFGEIPEGQRYSPDGRRILFFAQSPSAQGLYLYEPARRVLTRLSDAADRDPTFSADGRHVYFHTQTGDAAQGIAETGRLGMLTLEERGRRTTASRRMLDVAAGAYAFAQHPAPVVDSDVILYHRRHAAAGPNVLAARRTCDGAAPFDLALEVDGQPIVEAERPGTALRVREAVILGRFATDSRRRVFALSRAVVERVTRVAASSRCTRQYR